MFKGDDWNSLFSRYIIYKNLMVFNNSIIRISEV